MIRRALFDDIPAISALMAQKVQFFKNQDICFCQDAYEAKLAAAIGGFHDDVACFVSDAGKDLAAAILCYVILHPTIGERVGAEATWIADPRYAGHGRRVLEAAEGWFKEHRVRRLMVACNSTRTMKLLELLGYRETERTFEKVFSCH